MAPGIISDEAPNGSHEVRDEVAPPATNGHSVTKEEKLTNGSATKEEKLTNGSAIKEESKEESTTESKDNSTEESKDSKDSKDSKEEKVEDQTMKCEIKHLDRRYDDKDEQYFVERKNDIEKPKQKDWWQLFAFCLVRHYDSDGDHDFNRLYVNPQPLRQLLKDVVGNYPSDPIDVDDTQIDAPYHLLFHYRKELDVEGLKRFEGDAESLSQLAMLKEWIHKHFEQDIAAHDRCVSADVKAIGYERLWTLFRPQTIVYSKLLNQHRAFRVQDCWYDENEELPGLGLKVNFIDFDGDKLGTRKMELFIPKYNGTRELSELGTMPLDMLENVDEVREELITRGRKFENYIGQHFLQYDGIAVKKAQCGYARFNVSGRVMIDCKTYHRLDPNDSFYVKELLNDEAAKREKARRKAVGHTDFGAGPMPHDKLSDEDVALANSMARGYSFTVKRFLEFYVEELRPIEWNSSCFDSLVLDAGVKKTVQALVSTHSKKRDSFDDIVKGKGQGLVCVLHGPPGVGKTLTAECVAEYVQRPLYMVSSGDLGTSSTDLDMQLTKIMDMTSTWRAVLLIDEADIFLERRSLHDLHRNAMVSVFLRVLEYYSGILFLTTNRVNTFDEAFKSRIHIPIRYTDLSVDSRTKIWRNFCSMVPGGVDIDEVGLSILAEHDLNGRQIKNVIKAAESLAAFDGVKLDLAQLQQVTKIQATFEKDLTSLSGIDYTAPGSSKKDADSRNMFL